MQRTAMRAPRSCVLSLLTLRSQRQRLSLLVSRRRAQTHALKKANDFQLRSTVNGDETQLTGITFNGSDKDIVITNSGASTTGSSN